MSKATRVPDDLMPRGRGRAFWRAVTSEFALRADEVELLAEVCRQLDLMDALRQRVAADGPVVAGSRGQTRVHPALVELRATRIEVRRALASLGLPDEPGKADGGAVATLASRRGAKAARARWARQGGAAHA